MFYHIQIDYFCTEKQRQVLLTKLNISDVEDMRKRIVEPYNYGHSFKFQGVDILLASIHSFKIFESESAIATTDVSIPLESFLPSLAEVTQKFIKR